MTTITHVYVDMDGVLCSFCQGVLRLFGCVPAEQAELRVRGWGGLPDVINEGRPEWSHVSEDQVMTAVRDAGHQFWAELPICPWAYQLIGTIEQAGVPYTLLTTPAGGESAMGKFQWLLRHMPHMEKRVVLARDKWHLAGPGRLLVDDSPRNVGAWGSPPDGRPGGQAMLWPAPHNAERELKFTSEIRAQATVSLFDLDARLRG